MKPRILNACLLVLASFFHISCGSSVESDLLGTWGGGCVLGQKESWLFEESDYTYTVLIYEDVKCATLASTRIYYGTFSGGEGVKTPDSAKTFDYQFVRVTLKPETDTAAAALNTASLCTVTTWLKGTEQDITDKSCVGFATAKNVSTYSVYKISDSVVNFGRQTDGATDDGTSTSKRHLTLSALLLTKQETSN